jgi:hypothetical protein
MVVINPALRYFNTLSLGFGQTGNGSRKTNHGDRQSTVEHGIDQPIVSKNWRSLFKPLGHQISEG